MAFLMNPEVSAATLPDNGPLQPHLAAPACFHDPEKPWPSITVGQYLLSPIAPPDAISFFVYSLTGLPILPPWQFIAFRNASGTAGSIILAHSLTPRNGELIIASDHGCPERQIDPIVWNRPQIAIVARWLFEDLGLQRVTMRIKSHDRTAIDYAGRLGFKLEGRVRRAFADDTDALLFGLLASERSHSKLLKG